MSLYKQPGSEVWHTRFNFRGEPIRRSTRKYDREEAQRFEDELKAELWKRPPALKGSTWGKAVLKWTTNKNPSLTELQGIQKFSQFFADRPLSAVTADAINESLCKFCKNPATYNRHRARILGILNMSDVTIKLPPRRVEEKEARWLTPDEWARLDAELPKHMQHMARFAIATGLRQENVLGLTWSKVDLNRKLAWIEARTAKGKKAISVPLSIEALNVLQNVHGEHPEFCFTYHGHRVSETKTAFISACVRAEVGRYVNGQYEGFTWHGFRHTWATWHVQGGTPLDVLQKLGAWSDYKMVLKYGHHTAGYLSSYANNTTPKHNPRARSSEGENADLPNMGVDAPKMLPTKPNRL